MSVPKLCFICFGEASNIGEIPENARNENVSGSSKDVRVNGIPQKFANNICQYFQLRHPKHEEETSEQNFGYVCGVCEPLLKEFCGMHEKLLELEKRMKGKLEEISEVMTKAERETDNKEEFEAYQKCLQLQQKRRTGKPVNILGFRKEFLQKVKIRISEEDTEHTSSNAVPADPKVVRKNEVVTSKSPSLGDASTAEMAEKSLDRSASETDKPHLGQHTSRQRQSDRKASDHCIFCGKTFSNSASLKKHIISHTKEKSYNCKICNVEFASNQTLEFHINRHAGKKPYKCEFCRKRFVRSDSLGIHIRRHTLERPYKCQFCKKEFSTCGACKTHEKIHDEKISNCDKN